MLLYYNVWVLIMGLMVMWEFAKACGIYEERVEECELDLDALRRVFGRGGLGNSLIGLICHDRRK